MARYVVYYVLRDGNVHTTCETVDPFVALCWLEMQREKLASWGRGVAHGVADLDEPEDGDIDIEEIVHEYNGDIQEWRADQRELRRAYAGQGD